MIRAVHQVVAGAAPRDAITNHVLAAREHLLRRGFASRIFGEHVAGELTDRVSSVDRLADAVRPDDVVILHVSIASAGWTMAARTGARLAVHYHNITPPELLRRWNAHVADECERGREQLAGLADVVGLSTGDSAYNVAELAHNGYVTGEAVGILREPPARLARRAAPRTRGARLLFVGRGVPNKAHHDAIRSLAALREGVDPDATLRLIGAWSPFERYRAACEDLAKRLGVRDAVRFDGSVSNRALARAYRDADVFLCLSDHEGFCVPLLEAFAARLPVVAFASSAIAETAAGAALLLPVKPASLVAEAVGEIVRNGPLRAALARGQEERLAHFSPAAVTRRLDAFVEAVSA